MRTGFSNSSTTDSDRSPRVSEPDSVRFWELGLRARERRGMIAARRSLRVVWCAIDLMKNTLPIKVEATLVAINDEPDLGRARCKGGTLYRENVRGGVLEHKKAGQTAFKYAEFFRNCASRSRSLLLRSRGSPRPRFYYPSCKDGDHHERRTNQSFFHQSPRLEIWSAATMLLIHEQSHAKPHSPLYPWTTSTTQETVLEFLDSLSEQERIELL